MKIEGRDVVSVEKRFCHWCMHMRDIVANFFFPSSSWRRG